MRLGYLVPEFPSQTHNFFWREILAIRRLGEVVRLVSTRRPRPMTCPHEFAKRAVAETHYLFPPGTAAGVSWLAQGGPGLAQARHYLQALEWPETFPRQLALLASAIDLLQWSRREQIDHIHCHSCADAAHVVALASQMGGTSYSLTLHGDLDVYGKNHRSKMGGASFIFAVGNHLRKQVLQHVGVPADRVVVTCMGVEASELARLDDRRWYTEGKLHLVTVSRLHPAKGHLHALAVIRRGVQVGLDLHYTIAGEGEYKEAIQRRITELELTERVSMTGALSSEEVFELLSRSDAFLLPSTGLGEAWPVAVMEAMGAGLPVIASIIGATPEMITHGKDGFLIAQGDEDALLEKVFLLAREVELRRNIGREARLTALSRFNVDATARLLRDSVCTSGFDLRGIPPQNKQ